MSAAPETEVLRLTGALDFETLPGVIAQSERYVARPDLPARLAIDFSAVTGVDSSAVALLLEWRRRAAERRVALEFQHLPQNLMALAELYGVADLVRGDIPAAS